MILAPLDILYRDCVDPRFMTGLQFLSQIANNITTGRHELTGGAYVMVDEYTTVDESVHQFEAHRRYIDIHVVLQGQEKIQWCALADMNSHTPYDADNDYALFAPMDHATIQNMVMVPGVAIVFYPADSHRPGIIFDQPCVVRKAVVKVPV